MKYYDSDFRKKLQDILKTYRGMLTHQIASTDDENKNNLPLIESQIKQIDEALQIIKPSLADMLTEKKIEKLQKKDFHNAKVEEIRQQARKEFEKEIRENFTKEMEDKLREELKPKIRAEFEEELAQKQSEESFRHMKKQFVNFVQKAFQEDDRTPPPSTIKKTVKKNENVSADDTDYDTDPIPME